MPLAFLFNCYTLHSRSIAGIDMIQTLDIFANGNHFDDFVRKLLAAADERISDANSFGRSSISGVQVSACEQISRAANAYLANELRIGDFLSLLAAFAPLSGLGL